jgi:hypothetical protein
MTTFVFALLLLAQQPQEIFVGDRAAPETFTNPSMPIWYNLIGERLMREDSIDAQNDVTQLLDMYTQHPETQRYVLMLLITIVHQRVASDSADVYKPIIPTLIAHLSNPDKAQRAMAIGILSGLRPFPPIGIPGACHTNDLLRDGCLHGYASASSRDVL